MNNSSSLKNTLKNSLYTLKFFKKCLPKPNTSVHRKAAMSNHLRHWMTATKSTNNIKSDHLLRAISKTSTIAKSHKCKYLKMSNNDTQMCNSNWRHSRNSSSKTNTQSKNSLKFSSYNTTKGRNKSQLYKPKMATWRDNVMHWKRM